MFFAFLSAALACLFMGLAVRFAKKMVFGERPDNSFSLLFVVIYRIFFAASIIFALLTSFSCVGLILALFVLEAIVLSISTRIRMRRESLLNLLTLSTEYDLPLSDLAEAWRITSGVSSLHPESRFVELVSSGVPLNEALKQVPRALPGSTGVFVRASCGKGSIGLAFRAAIEQETQGFALRKVIRNCLTYATIIPLIIGFILSFVMLKIVPAFKKIFEDFGLNLPTFTELLITVSDWLVVIFPLLIFPLMLMWGYLVALTFFGNLIARTTYLFQPGIRTLNIAALLRLLALVVEQNQPLIPTLEFLAAEHPHRPMRLKLRKLLADAESGQDWCESLRRVKLIGASDVALLRSAQRLGNLPWALRQTADSLTRRTMLRLEAVMEVLFPLLVIGLGMCVGFIVIALFLPLIKLIQSLVN